MRGDKNDGGNQRCKKVGSGRNEGGSERVREEGALGVPGKVQHSIGPEEGGTRKGDGRGRML